MTRLRMEIPKLPEGRSVSSPRGSRIWLDGQEHQIADIEISGGTEGCWQAKITFNVAIESITQEDAPASLQDVAGLLKAKEQGA